jgi:ubiquinone/menaquinone biosynthesis C-methylase UbiE
MYTKSAAFYDAIYAFKDYQREAEILNSLICKHRRSPGNTLLDIACGTGAHLVHLQAVYIVKGLDINSELLAIAHERCPSAEFYEADMVDFDLGHQVDVITCLFSAIGYVQTVPRLRQTIQTMSRHTKPGGVILVEPWFTPEKWKTGSVHATFVDQPDLKISRMSISERNGDVSRNEFHYLVATPAGIQYFTECHELGLFTHDDYLAAFRDSGLEVIHDPEGLDGRGLYIGLRS